MSTIAAHLEKEYPDTKFTFLGYEFRARLCEAKDGRVFVGFAPAASREAKKKLILNAIERARGNYTEAAKLLGVHPNYLHRLIRNLSLKKGTAS